VASPDTTAPKAECRYFSDELIEANFVFSLAPSPFMTEMIASAMPAEINPYSIAVAPESSDRNAFKRLIILVVLPGRYPRMTTASQGLCQTWQQAGQDLRWLRPNERLLVGQIIPDATRQLLPSHRDQLSRIHRRLTPITNLTSIPLL
jgi:hypothetical protein